MCVCVYIHTYIHHLGLLSHEIVGMSAIYIYIKPTYMCTKMHTDTHYIYIYIYIYIYVCVCVHTHIYTPPWTFIP